MDILGISKREIEELTYEELYLAISYCWITYTTRRVDYTLIQMFGGKDNKKHENLTFNHEGLMKYNREKNIEAYGKADISRFSYVPPYYKIKKKGKRK